MRVLVACEFSQVVTEAFLPTCIVKPEFSLCDKYRDAKRRSIFSPCIAAAMADAWYEE